MSGPANTHTRRAIASSAPAGQTPGEQPPPEAASQNPRAKKRPAPAVRLQDARPADSGSHDTRETSERISGVEWPPSPTLQRPISTVIRKSDKVRVRPEPDTYQRLVNYFELGKKAESAAERQYYRKISQLIKKYSEKPLFEVPKPEEMSRLSFKEMQERFHKSIDSTLIITDEFLEDRASLDKLRKAVEKPFALWCGKTAREFVSDPEVNYSMDTDMALKVFGIPLMKRLEFIIDKAFGRESKGGIQIYGKSFGEYIQDLSTMEMLMLDGDVDLFFAYPEDKDEGLVASTETFLYHVEIPILQKMRERGLVANLFMYGPPAEDFSGNTWKMFHVYDFDQPNGGIPNVMQTNYHGEHMTDEKKRLSKIGGIYDDLQVAARSPDFERVLEKVRLICVANSPHERP